MKRFLLLTALFFFPILSFANSLENIIFDYIYTQRWDEAATELNKYLYKNPQDHEAFAILSSVESERANHAAAIQAMRKAISYVTNDEKKSEYYYNLSIVYFRQNMTEAAIECNLIANKLNPTLPNPYYINGIMLFNQERREDALNSWKKFLIYSSNSELNEKINQVTKLLEEYLSQQKTQEEKEKLDQQLSMIIPTPIPNYNNQNSSTNSTSGNSADGQNGNSTGGNPADGQNDTSTGSNSADGQNGNSAGSNSADGQNDNSTGSNSADGQNGNSTGGNSADGQNGNSTG